MRIIRTCKEMNIKTVAVHSKADSESLHVRFADEAVCIGPAASSESYLKMSNIIAAAEITNADAIHPGYGFLSENAKFSKICEEHRIKFIGASADMINQMGDKASAKATMKEAGVPTIPGSEGLLESLEEAGKIAEGIGYPVMLKASAGGGGKGIRVAYSDEEVLEGFPAVKAEAKNAFGDDRVFIEKFIRSPRHVEIQVLGDKHGNVIHLFEQTQRVFGTPTGLVNNAGVVDVSARLDEMSMARWRRMFDINVLGSMLCAREAILEMSTRHGGVGGSIVNLSSAAARLGSPSQYLDYAAAKGAIDSFTLGLAKEVAGEGIRVNAVRPGLIDTEIHASGGLPNRVKDLEHLVPAKRGGSAMEVAQAIVWLLSDDASYTTMSLVDVSGGR